MCFSRSDQTRDQHSDVLDQSVWLVGPILAPSDDPNRPQLTGWMRAIFLRVVRWAPRAHPNLGAVSRRWLKHQAPRRGDVGARFGRRVDERDEVSRQARGAAALEECDASVAVQAGREPDGAGASVKKARGDRLRDGAATGGDLV
jgi:hypothetical protein